jgi:hypothetical protein
MTCDSVAKTRFVEEHSDMNFLLPLLRRVSPAQRIELCFSGRDNLRRWPIESASPKKR